MKISIGADHAGYELKEKLKQYIQRKGLETEDMGTDSTESTDYPDYSFKVAKSVVRGDSDFGILVCWTGNGMAIAANRLKKARAALCLNERMAELSRQHNNANILCIPSLFVDEENAYKILDKFLSSEFEGGRHERRVNKIDNYD
ncbi:MAG: ribose 5-phosphate isomerase B [candidate division Zixibacteria bacterium]|nr:ribose 5-phosphate isomerase B [candidate division Zixibacteria bacterium]